MRHFLKYNKVRVKRFWLAAILVVLGLTVVQAKTRIMLISDPHVMGPGLLIKEGDAWDEVVYYDRKLTEYSRAIYDEMIAIALREKPDLFLIPGDLTKDGELLSHQYVVEKLQLLKAAGIKAFVIPGNHDLGTSDALHFDGPEAYEAEVVDAKQFAELYRDFGYGEDVQRDENSLSWCCEPIDGLVLIGIDTGQDGTKLNGCVSGPSLSWIFNQALDAQAQGKLTLVMMHHSLFPHVVNVEKLNATYTVRLGMKMLYDDEYYYMDYSYILGRLAYAGVPVVFSGHTHVLDIAKDANTEMTRTVFDISTATCAGYPNPYRLMTISDDRKSMRVYTRYLTELKGVDNFSALSEERMKSGLRNFVWENTHDEEIGNLFADIYRVHVMGNEPSNPRQHEYLDMYYENLPRIKEDSLINVNLRAYEVTFNDLENMVHSMLEDKSNYGNPYKENYEDDLDATIPLDGEGWTAIRSVTRETLPDDDLWYTLQGVRIPQPSRKGTYIHGRRLVILK